MNIGCADQWNITLHGIPLSRNVSQDLAIFHGVLCAIGRCIRRWMEIPGESYTVERLAASRGVIVIRNAIISYRSSCNERIATRRPSGEASRTREERGQTETLRLVQRDSPLTICQRLRRSKVLYRCKFQLKAGKRTMNNPLRFIKSIIYSRGHWEPLVNSLSCFPMHCTKKVLFTSSYVEIK